MDKSVLVAEYITEGKKIIKGLDQLRFPVSSALWFYFPESDSWRLLIASKKLEEEGPIKVYERIQKVIKEKKIKDISLSDVSAVSPSYGLIPILKVAVHTGPKALNEIRFTANTINNNYIEDALIYRIS